MDTSILYIKTVSLQTAAPKKVVFLTTSFFPLGLNAFAKSQLWLIYCRTGVVSSVLWKPCGKWWIRLSSAAENGSSYDPQKLMIAKHVDLDPWFSAEVLWNTTPYTHWGSSLLPRCPKSIRAVPPDPHPNVCLRSRRQIPAMLRHWHPWFSKALRAQHVT